MGNAQARQRLKGSDFHYLSKFTAFANNEVRKYKLVSVFQVIKRQRKNNCRIIECIVNDVLNKNDITDRNIFLTHDRKSVVLRSKKFAAVMAFA